MSQSEAGQNVIDISVIFGAIWRGKWILLISMMIMGVLGGYYAYNVATPLYRSSIVVMMESRQEQVLSIDSVIGNLSRDGSALNTEVEVLQSRTLIGKVVDKLNLTEDPEFNASLRAPSLKDELKGWMKGSLSAMTGAARNTSSTALAGEERDTRIHASTVSALLRGLTVEILPRSLVFQITVATEDPRKSALIADTLADLYILNQLEVKFEATERATSWLAQRVSELQGELEVSEARVKEFNSSTDLISQEALSKLDRQLKETRDRISNMDADQLSNEAKLSAMKGAETPQQKTEISNDAQLMILLAQTDAEDEFEKRFQQVVARAELEVQRGNNQIKALKNSEAALAKQIESQSADLITLQQMNREAEATRLLYEYFLTRLKETSAQQGLQQADSRVLSYAVVPGSPSAPRKSLIIVACSLLGFLIGALLILVQESRASTFRTSRELEMGTRYPVLGQVPLLPARRRGDAISYLSKKPTSAAAEAFRNLRTSLLLSNIDNPPQVIMVTSAFPGEGKTTVSIALAQNLSQMGKRVLLIEGDIRRRIFSHYFEATDHTQGLISVLSGEAKFEDVITRNAKYVGADVLFSGKSSTNAADIFSSERFVQFIKKLRGEYDQVIIDTPPVLVAPDARVVAQVCDSVVYVVKWNDTPQAQVSEALRMLESVNATMSGTVLNQVDPKGMRRYGYGKYEYGVYTAAGYGKNYYTN